MQERKTQDKRRRSWLGTYGASCLYAGAAVLLVIPVVVPQIAIVDGEDPVPGVFYLGALFFALLGRLVQQKTDDGNVDLVELTVLGGSGILLLLGFRSIANGSFELGGLEVEPVNGNVASDLGNAIVGGLIVSVAILLIDRASSRRASRRAETSRAFAEQQQAAMLLASHASLSCADLSGRDFSWWYFRGMGLQNFRARRSCFFRANLEEVSAAGAEFQDADLTNAFCADADFVGAHFNRCRFTHAHMKRAVLRSADLTDTHFDNAHLNGADFTSACLQGATFGGADVTDAVFDDADLRGADLSGVSGASRVSLARAKIDEKTVLHPAMDSNDCITEELPKTPESDGPGPLPPERPVCARAHAAEMAWIDDLRHRLKSDGSFVVARHRPSRTDLKRARIRPDPGRFYLPD